ncbi:MAG: hypothetical protein AAFX03_03280 [Pseudomonadota bacterium]
MPVAHGSSVPRGYKPLPPRGPFIETNGPIYRAVAQDLNRYGFLFERRHCNGVGFAHGGMITTFLDSIMAQTIADQTRRSLVTVSLEVSFDNLTPGNRWIEAEVALGEEADDHIAASAEMRWRGSVCARGQGLYKLMRARQPIRRP